MLPPDKTVEIRQEAVEAQKPAETTQTDNPTGNNLEDKIDVEKDGNQNQP